MQTMTTTSALQFLLGTAATSDLPPLLSISGPTQSGKTTFSNTLSQALRKAGTTTTLVCLDDYFLDVTSPALPRDEQGGAVFDLPESYASHEFISHVMLLLSGTTIDAPVYNKSRNKREQKVTQVLVPAKLIIAEGLFAEMFLASISSAWHVFIDTDRTTCFERKVKTDMALYGVTRTDVEDIFCEKILPYWERVMSQKDHANIVITN
jgi:uridine kinase